MTAKTPLLRFQAPYHRSRVARYVRATEIDGYWLPSPASAFDYTTWAVRRSFKPASQDMLDIAEASRSGATTDSEVWAVCSYAVARLEATSRLQASRDLVAQTVAAIPEVVKRNGREVKAELYASLIAGVATSKDPARAWCLAESLLPPFLALRPTVPAIAAAFEGLATLDPPRARAAWAASVLPLGPFSPQIANAAAAGMLTAAAALAAAPVVDPLALDAGESENASDSEPEIEAVSPLRGASLAAYVDAVLGDLADGDTPPDNALARACFLAYDRAGVAAGRAGARRVTWQLRSAGVSVNAFTIRSGLRYAEINRDWPLAASLAGEMVAGCYTPFVDLEATRSLFVALASASAQRIELAYFLTVAYRDAIRQMVASHSMSSDELHRLPVEPLERFLEVVVDDLESGSLSLAGSPCPPDVADHLHDLARRLVAAGVISPESREHTAVRVLLCRAARASGGVAIEWRSKGPS